MSGSDNGHEEKQNKEEQSEMGCGYLFSSFVEA